MDVKIGYSIVDLYIGRERIYNMSISKRTLAAAACMCLACGFSLFAVTRTVAQNGTGAFKTIQSAINASAPGDIV